LVKAAVPADLVLVAISVLIEEAVPADLVKAIK
jgi:hypothetical protein